VRIPDGDLMPARRHKYRGSYGRSRRRSRGMAVVLLVLVVAGATAWYLRRDDGTPAAQALAPCPTPSPTASPVPLPPNRLVRVVVLNGTVRQGLAHTVAVQLHARGFVVVREDNFPRAVTGGSVVSYAPGLKGAATVLARNIAGAHVSDQAKAPAGTVEVVLGSGFRRLATPAEVAATGQASVVPAPSATGTRAPCAP
jgi:hypothetical protein